LLFQLQQLRADARPKPALDVLPSTSIVPRLTKRFPRMFRGKSGLGVNDVMVVRSEDYNTPDDHFLEGTDSDEEVLGNRQLMAVICEMPKDLGGSQGRAEIVLHDGSVWVATPMAGNIYEFYSVTDKITARWVKRSSSRKSVDFSATHSPVGDFKFIFSILDPNSRRHPIMASLTQTTLDIPDNYTTVSSSSGRNPPTSPMGPLHDDHSADDEPHIQRTTCTIDEDTRALIQITGIWVALRQGMSPYFRYNDAMASTAGRVRSNSTTPESSKHCVGESLSPTPDSTASAFGSVSGKIRRTCAKASPASISSIRFEPGATPRRSISTGTAFMQRAAARRVTNAPSTFAPDSEAETMIIGPPVRAATLDMTTRSSQGNRQLATPSLHLPGSAATTPDTPTRPQRRPHSTYIPFTPTENYHRSTPRHSVDAAAMRQIPEVGEKGKNGRWKAFTNLFRRNNARSA